jgi:hypothetical protein
MPQTCFMQLHTQKRQRASHGHTHMRSDMHADCSMPLGSWRMFCSSHARNDRRPALAQGHKCDIVYFDVYPNSRLEEYSKEYSRLLESHGEEPLSVRRLDTVEDVLKQSDVSAVARVVADTACGPVTGTHVAASTPC